MMKLKLLLLLALLTGTLSYAQPSLQLQAYKQPVMPGTVPVRISENGAPGTKVEKKYTTNYYFYLTYPKSTTIQPQQVWIKGKAYKINAEPVRETPVLHINRNIPMRPDTTVMVAKTSNKVVRLVPVSLAETATPTAAARKLMESSELVVSYKWKGKTYYKTVKKIAELEPLMAE